MTLSVTHFIDKNNNDKEGRMENIWREMVVVHFEITQNLWGKNEDNGRISEFRYPASGPRY
jgi:hypothetical protein